MRGMELVDVLGLSIESRGTNDFSKKRRVEGILGKGSYYNDPTYKIC